MINNKQKWFFSQDWSFYYHPFLIYFSMKVIETGLHFKTNLNSKYNCLQDMWSENRSVVSDSLWPHGLYSPWNSPGQNIGVGSFPISRGSSQPRARTQVSRIAGRLFTSWDTREAGLQDKRYKNPQDIPWGEIKSFHQFTHGENIGGDQSNKNFTYNMCKLISHSETG